MLDHRSSTCFPLFFVLLSLVIGTACAHAADDETTVRELGKIKTKRLREISGVAASRQNPGILWLHNDGSSRFVYGINTSGKLAAMVSWPNEIEDFEEIALAPGPKAGTDYLYIGDIGDNNENRREIRIVRFAEPQVSELQGGQFEVQSAEEFRFTYPDRPHNAEAFIVDPVSGDLFIVTKEHRNALLFTCPASRLKDEASTELKFIGALAFQRVSGGAITRDGRRIILRREDQGWLWNRARGQSVAAALQTAPEKIPVRSDRQGRNGEAISFSPDGNSYFTVSEGNQQVICEFQMPAASSDPGR